MMYNLSKDNISAHKKRVTFDYIERKIRLCCDFVSKTKEKKRKKNCRSRPGPKCTSAIGLLLSTAVARFVGRLTSIDCRRSGDDGVRRRLQNAVLVASFRLR